MDNGTMSLLPVIDVPDFVEPEEDYDIAYRPSPAWDMAAGDFARNPDNDVPMSDGHEALKVWCAKAVATERYTCLAYSDDIGTEIDEDVIGNGDREAATLALQRTIEETLMVNPRVSSVDEFEFEWGAGGRVYVRFTVNAIDGEPFTIDSTINT